MLSGLTPCRRLNRAASALSASASTSSSRDEPTLQAAASSACSATT